jgi:catechol 2,3-dioxygenase-like lactoylglutathione lyase family enzyme
MHRAASLKLVSKPLLLIKAEPALVLTFDMIKQIIKIMKINIKIGIIMLAFSVFTTVAEAQKHDTGFKMPALNPESPLAGLSGNHIGIRVPDYTAAIKWYTEKLDFRVIHEWPYADEKLAYLAPANTNAFWVEILAGGKLKPVTKYSDLGKSLEEPGFHHICMDVASVDKTVAELKKRGVVIVGKTFYLQAINRKLAFFQDPWGNMIELAEVVKK